MHLPAGGEAIDATLDLHDLNDALDLAGESLPLFVDLLDERLSHEAGCCISTIGCASTVGFCACTLSTLCCGCPSCLETSIEIDAE